MVGGWWSVASGRGSGSSIRNPKSPIRNIRPPHSIRTSLAGSPDTPSGLVELHAGVQRHVVDAAPESTRGGRCSRKSCDFGEVVARGSRRRRPAACRGVSGSSNSTMPSKGNCTSASSRTWNRITSCPPCRSRCRACEDRLRLGQQVGKDHHQAGVARAWPRPASGCGRCRSRPPASGWPSSESTSPRWRPPATCGGRLWRIFSSKVISPTGSCWWIIR